MEQKPDISLVIACYNEANHLEQNIHRIESILQRTKYSYEFLLIDDASQDDTAEIIKKITENKEIFSAFFHNKNVGRGGTVREGLLKARGTYIGFLDIDLEVHPQYLFSLITALEEGADVATVKRVYKWDFSLNFLIRTILSVIYKKIVKVVLQLPYDDTETGFKFFNRQKTASFITQSENNGWFWDTEIMAIAHHSNLKVVELPGLFIRNDEKQSTVKPFIDSIKYLRSLYNFRKKIYNPNTNFSSPLPSVSNLMKNFIKDHWLAIIIAFLVGIIYIGPHLWFIVSNSDVYQGIPLMQSANEDFYIARIQEIVNGHPLVGSQALFEYKDQLPLSPPTSEFLYALPTLILGVPIVATLNASNFILPTLLFLLVYALLYRLLSQSNEWPRKVSAIAGALFITLGYDLIDYRTVFSLIQGRVEPSSWLIWSRPVNPIMGAIYLFSFLHFLWSVIQNNKRHKVAIVGAGFFLAIMFASYFFSWGLALSILLMLGLFYLLQRNYLMIKRLIFIFIFGLLISFPYWYLSWQAKQSIWYQDSLLRNGVFYTHYPLLNKLLLVTLVVYIVASIFKLPKNFKLSRLERVDFFILSFLLGGLFAFNQQIITGVTIWPFHFVQYTIPLSIIAMIAVLCRIVYERSKMFWILIIVIVVVASVWSGISIQSGTYVKFLEHNKSVQSYAPVFNWFNQQEKDCVVLVSAAREQFIELSGMILAFTHCNIYANTWVYSLMPEERRYHSYLVNLRFRGVSADGIDEYLKKNNSEMRTYLSSNWVGLYEHSVFPDFEDLKLSKRAERLPNDYRQFLDKDLSTELNEYRLDFILSIGPLAEQIKDQLPNIELLNEISGLSIYKYY